MVSSQQLVRLCAGHKPMRMRAALETLNHPERQRGRASAHGGRAAVFQQHGCAGISEGGTKRWKYGMSRPFYLKRARCSPRADSVRSIRSHRRIPPAICPIPTIICRFGISPEAAVSIGWRGEKHLMARGDIFIVPPKVEHQVVRLEDAEIISCEFSFDQFFSAEGEQRLSAGA